MIWGSLQHESRLFPSKAGFAWLGQFTALVGLAVGCSSKPSFSPGGDDHAGGSAGTSGAPNGGAGVGGTAPAGTNGVGLAGAATGATGGAGSSAGASAATGGIGASGTANGASGMVNTAGAGPGSGGMTSSGGSTTVGGAPGAGNAGSTAQLGGNGGAAGTGGAGACGTLNLHPFGCEFAWGIADPGGSSYSSYGYLDFISYWVDSSISPSGTYDTCYGCTWLASLAGTNLTPVYVAYIIGFLGHANGIVDGNQDGARKLTTDGAELIRDHRQAIVDAYAWYAQKTHAAWPDKPLVWMLEGDFVQYTDDGETNPLSYDELAALAADITCAIKGNMPNAVVAIDQSSWDSDDVTNQYWGALAKANVNYDMVWTTGVGNNDGYIESGTDDTTYNHATATYAYLHSLTGRTIMVDTSAGISAAGDSWSVASSDDLDARMAEGVVAADITGTPPDNLESNLATLRPALGSLPACP
jgi:hypothetical protein